MLDISLHSAVKYNRLQDVKNYISLIKSQVRLDTLLSTASYSNYSSANMLELLIDAGASPNSYITQISEDRTYYGGTPLGLAACRGSIEKVNLLLKRGADVHFGPPGKGTVLIGAVHAPAASVQAIVECLISHGARLADINHGSPTPIESASRDGKFNVVKMLLDAGADDSELKWDQLKKALVFGSLDECIQAIKNGCSLSESDSWDRSPLLLSMLVGDIDKSELLIRHGASLSEKGRCESTCLMHAVRKNDAEMCRWLISKGVDVNESTEFGTTALIEAAQYGAADCVKILLEAGADLDEQTVTQGSAIENAVNIETVKILMDAGANINRIGGDGHNLLMNATERTDYHFVREILELGADPNAASTGEISLHKAARYDEIEIIKVLLQYGSNPNALDVDNETPLHWLKSVEAARLLMDAGSRADIRNIVGQTAIDNAEDEDIKKYLLSRTQ